MVTRCFWRARSRSAARPSGTSSWSSGSRRSESPGSPEIPTAAKPRARQLILEPGDILCVYTDGVIEAMNASGEQYDLPRLMRALSSAAEAPSLDEGLAEMFADFDAFSDRLEDDRTVLLVMRRD